MDKINTNINQSYTNYMGKINSTKVCDNCLACTGCVVCVIFAPIVGLFLAPTTGLSLLSTQNGSPP